MKCLLLFLALSIMVVRAESNNDGLEEGEFHTETVEHETEEEVTILDKDGNVVSTVDIFEDEGYLIDKPAEGEEHLCLLRALDETDEGVNANVACFVRRAVSHAEATGLNMTRILDHCGNRSLYILETQDCDKIDKSETEMNRKKRSLLIGSYGTCCHYNTYLTTGCYYYTTYCCRRNSWYCYQWCRQCVSYSVRLVTEKTCYWY